MKSTSKESAATLIEALESALATSEENKLQVAREFFFIADAFHDSPALRGAAVDPGRAVEDRVALVKGLFEGKVTGIVLHSVEQAVTLQWAQEADLVETMESLGVRSALVNARVNERLAQVEDEIHQINRVLVDNPALRVVLSTPEDYTLESRIGLAHDVFGEVHEESRLFLNRAIDAVDQRTLAETLVNIMYKASRMSHSFAATVWSATPLEQQQIERLERILTSLYGRDITVHTSVDPSVVGGLKIQCGSEVIDATLLSRIKDIRDKIVGATATSSQAGKE